MSKDRGNQNGQAFTVSPDLGAEGPLIHSGRAWAWCNFGQQ